MGLEPGAFWLDLGALRCVCACGCPCSYVGYTGASLLFPIVCFISGLWVRTYAFGLCGMFGWEFRFIILSNMSSCYVCFPIRALMCADVGVEFLWDGDSLGMPYLGRVFIISGLYRYVRRIDTFRLCGMFGWELAELGLLFIVINMSM